MENDIILKAQSGDEDSFSCIAREHASLIYNIINSFHIKNGDRDDLYQEGLIALHKAVKKYNPQKEVPFSAFAGNIISIHLIGVLRKSTREKQQILNSALSLDDINKGIGNLIPAGNNPADTLVEKEEASELHKQINLTLSKMESDVLHLFLRGYSYKEIAFKKGISKKSVDNSLTRIRRKISKERRTFDD